MKRLVPCPHSDVKLKLNWFLGNGPDSRKDLMEVFEEAAKRGVIIINITQCARGTVSASYAPGRVSTYLFLNDFANHTILPRRFESHTLYHTF